MLSVLNENQLINLDAFLKWLSNYNRSDTNFYKQAFQNLHQNNLSFMSYYLKLRNLYFKYKGKSNTDSLTQNEKEELCRQYIKNLAIKKVKDALLNQPNLTSDMDDPEKGLVSQSNFFAQRFNECTEETVSSTNIAISDPMTQVAEEIKNLFLMIAYDRKKSKIVRFDKKSIRCFNCGRFGHIQADCRINKKGRRGRSKSNGRIINYFNNRSRAEIGQDQMTDTDLILIIETDLIPLIID